MASKSMATVGYGVATNEIDPQRFVVRIPMAAPVPRAVPTETEAAAPARGQATPAPPARVSTEEMERAVARSREIVDAPVLENAAHSPLERAAEDSGEGSAVGSSPMHGGAARDAGANPSAGVDAPPASD